MTNGKKPSLLYVEDELEHSRFHIEFLEEKGYPVIVYEDFNKAYEDIKNNTVKYDVALIDLSYGDDEVKTGSNIMHSRSCTGRDVMDISKKMNPNAKIINVSGWWYEIKEADIHLQKPFDFKDLEEAIKKAWDKR